MRAIKIDVFKMEVKEIDFEGNFEDIQKEIGCDCFTCVTLNDKGDTLFVDDNGLFNPNLEFFTIEGFSQPLAGNGLILGTDLETGDSKGTDMEVPEVKFPSRLAIQIMAQRGDF